MIVEWNAEEKCWIIDGKKYWTWNIIHKVLKLKIKLVELQESVFHGVVGTTFFNIPEDIGSGKRVQGFLVNNIKLLQSSKYTRTKSIEQQLEERDEYLKTQEQDWY